MSDSDPARPDIRGQGVPGAECSAAPAPTPSTLPTTLADQVAADLAAFRAGETAALSGLVRRVTPMLWQIARGFRLDPAAAERVVTNALLALVRRGDPAGDPRTALCWLAATTRAEALRALRRRYRTDEPLIELNPGSSARVLWRGVSRLPDRCQQLLRVVSFVAPADYPEVSAALDISVGALGPTRGRCLATLRALLAADPDWAS